jgi:hypothetical protein
VEVRRDAAVLQSQRRLEHPRDTGCALGVADYRLDAAHHELTVLTFLDVSVAVIGEEDALDRSGFNG